MDITTLAAWGEFLGGIAVVVSLIYLASQIRQNSKLLRASTASATAQIQYSQNSMMVQDPEVARIYWDGIVDRDSLSDADRRRFDPLMAIMFQGNDQQYRFDRQGIASPGAWEQVERGMRWQFQQPGIRQWWRAWRDVFDNEFSEFVDGLIREGEAAA